jgi:hypothetical protein
MYVLDDPDSEPVPRPPGPLQSELTLIVARLCGRLNISARAGTSDDMCDFIENVIKISTSFADRHPDFVRCPGQIFRRV